MKHILSVLFGAASYGVLSTFVVLAYGKGYTLGEVVGSQMLVGFVLSCLLAAYIKRKKKTSVAAASNNRTSVSLNVKQKVLLMAAGMPSAITGLLYYESLRYVPASLAILLLFQFTWMSVLVQSAGRRKRPTAAIGLSLAILLGGTLLASGVAEQGAGQFDLRGIMLGLLAAISYTMFILFSGKAVPQAQPAIRSMWMNAGALLLVYVLFPPQFLWNGGLFSELMLFGGLLGLFGAFIPPLLFAYGVPHVGEGLAGILAASELPVAVMLSSIVLHEEVSWLQWVGVAVVLTGVAFPEWSKRWRRISLRKTPGGAQT